MTEAKTSEAQKPEDEQLDPLSVDPNQLLETLAKELQAMPQVKPPAWAPFVKTGSHKERPPQRADWWYVRTAAVLRTVARLGPVGTSKLRTKFGGKHSRGFKSERFAPGSGSILRKALQQLEKAGLVKQTVKGVHKGRIITEKASSLLQTAAKAASTPRKPKIRVPVPSQPSQPAPQPKQQAPQVDTDRNSAAPEKNKEAKK